MRDRQHRTQLARAPLRRLVGGLALQRPIQNPRPPRLGSAYAGHARGMATEQPRQPLPSKPLAPAADKRIVAVQLVADLRPAMARLQQQDQPRSPPILRRPLRLAARWLSSTRSASVSPILFLINTIILPFIRYKPLVGHRSIAAEKPNLVFRTKPLFLRAPCQRNTVRNF
jgi:hypothetical protein